MLSHLLSFQWSALVDPLFYINNGGFWLIIAIIFAETGLFAGFFLPGDSLLFVSGIYSQQLINSVNMDTGNPTCNVLLLILFIIVSAIVGNRIGYWIGDKFGHRMHHWKDGVLFKKEYLHRAHNFYEKHGGAALVYSRFLPIVRTFVPLIAGIVEMSKKKFWFYSIIGTTAWVISMVAGGHYLYNFFKQKFDFDLTEHLESIVIGMVLISTVPIVIKLFLMQKKKI